MARRLMASLLFILLAGSTRVEAQSPDPARGSDSELRAWAARALTEAAADDAGAWPSAWKSLESGSLDTFMARGGDFTRVFPSPGSHMAAAVTWSRPTRAGGAAGVTARLSLRDADGVERAAFPVEPLMAFDVTDDGRAIVGHGTSMTQVIACGAFRTTLAFYAPDGRLLGRVDRGDFSPGYSTAFQQASRRFVIGTTGQLLAYDLDSGREAWRRPLNPNERPWLVAAPDGDDLVVTVTPRSGPTRLLRVDAAGSERASSTFAGRINPGSGVALRDGLLVVHEVSTTGSTIRVLEPGTLRARRSVIQSGSGAGR